MIFLRVPFPNGTQMIQKIKPKSWKHFKKLFQFKTSDLHSLWGSALKSVSKMRDSEHCGIVVKDRRDLIVFLETGCRDCQISQVEETNSYFTYKIPTEIGLCMSGRGEPSWDGRKHILEELTQSDWMWAISLHTFLQDKIKRTKQLKNETKLWKE